MGVSETGGPNIVPEIVRYPRVPALFHALGAGVDGSGCGISDLKALLGGSWVVLSRVTMLITHIRGLITPPITTPEPPSKALISSRVKAFANSAYG